MLYSFNQMLFAKLSGIARSLELRQIKLVQRKHNPPAMACQVACSL
ncbi:hypothetical protein EIKCOROL_00737 [Eikenella corrodens ATCC 23834]|uniref:Uncharacterized protein n=1 Tax=Eikenella corrodens ATCC 23834 TaxID=546274 RepID=C0DTQ7_EIKCO|nr:hypothetical protein EIKCOROL_00737 [Eikenella corrodens ATCC 23834]